MTNCVIAEYQKIRVILVRPISPNIKGIYMLYGHCFLRRPDSVSGETTVKVVYQIPFVHSAYTKVLCSFLSFCRPTCYTNKPKFKPKLFGFLSEKGSTLKGRNSFFLEQTPY